VVDPCPETMYRDGESAFGTYRGRLGDTRMRLGERGVSRLRQAISDKRWQWFAGFDGDLAVGGAIVDGGAFGTAFLWVFDRERGTLLVDEDVIVPPQALTVTTHPTIGTLARIGVPGYRLALSRRHDTVAVDGVFGDATIDLTIEVDDDSAITAICPVPDRSQGINITQKEPGAPIQGTIALPGSDGESRTLDGQAFLDYTHGLHGRETRWDWAFASTRARYGTPIAFNLVDKFNDGLENVVWIDGSPEAVGAATVTADAASDTWRVTTACDTVDGELSVEGTRAEDVSAGPITSSYTQPLGIWRGTVAGHEVEGVGVAEEHLTRW
jgi:hypothetical protein